MSKELSYLLITPHTIAKSRTGGVISRLLSRIDLNLVGAQVFAPSEKMANEYAHALYEQVCPRTESGAQILKDYVTHWMIPSEGRRHRAMLLLFEGENACRKLSDIAGALFPENRGEASIRGETIRDTYAGLIKDERGKVVFFEPAVLTPRNQEEARKNMSIFSSFIELEDNIVENMVCEGDNIQRTLVIIKPDNWKYPSSRPGTIIDMFSRTGLRMIGCKIYQMSINEALEFYGPVEAALKKKLGPLFGTKAKCSLEKEYNLSLSEEVEKELQDSFGKAFAKDQFYKIIEFMSGRRPDSCSKDDYDKPGKVKCMALIYEGQNAINKIRDVLGPTDPTKAPGGTIRREFGSDIMVNTAHASDAPENAEREMDVIKIQKNNSFKIMKEYLES